MSDRDRKILIALVPILVLAAYWFLLLAPKREEAASAGKELTEQTEQLDAARAVADRAKGAKTDFAADYGEIVRLGKAIPASVDMPSLLVQLDAAAAGTGIRFTRIATGEREGAATTPPPSSGTSSAAPSAAAGGAPAQSAPGQATEAANNAAQTSDQANAAAQQSGVSAGDTQTSTSSGSGLPVGGGTAAPTAASGGAAPAGLETVPLELEFVGDFFNLADFFHDIKRFVDVANRRVVVGGRLITVEGVRFSSDPELFPRIKAELDATVYLSPKAEGTTAGASPQGPAPTTGDAPQATPANGNSPSNVIPAPTATATP